MDRGGVQRLLRRNLVWAMREHGIDLAGEWQDEMDGQQYFI
jgi:hypothetical protein